MTDETTDFGFKKVNIHEKRQRVTEVFNSVAHRYDIMNDLMSFGIHRLWKRQAIAHCQIRPFHHVLDLAAGTGDLACLIAPRLALQGKLTLSDINMAMLVQAKKRLLDKGSVENIYLTQANAEYLPFAANTFDRIIISFGLRNVTFKEKALANMYHVLKPGGRLVILEFSKPNSEKFAKIYDAYSFYMLPLMGKWVANDSESYRYLAESIRMHPNQEELKSLILSCGFNHCEYQNITGGVVAIHKGIKY